MLQKQGVEISRATAPFTVTVPGKKAPARPTTTTNDGRAGRAGSGTGGPSAQEQAGGAGRAGQEARCRRRARSPLVRTSSAWISPTAASPTRCSTTSTGARTIRSARRTTTPAGRSPSSSTCRPCASTDAKVLDAAMEKVSGDVRAQGRRRLRRSPSVFARQPQRRHRARDAALQAQGRVVRSGRRTVRRRRQEIQPRLVHHHERRRRRLQKAAVRSRPPGRRDRHRRRRSRPIRSARRASRSCTRGRPRRPKAGGARRSTTRRCRSPTSARSRSRRTTTSTRSSTSSSSRRSAAAREGIVNGMPMWGNPLPWKKTAETPNLGSEDQTDDMRPGLGWTGVAHLQDFVRNGGLLLTVMDTADLAVSSGFTPGLSVAQRQRLRIVGSVVRSKMVDADQPHRVRLHRQPRDLVRQRADLQRLEHVRRPRRTPPRAGRWRQPADGPRHDRRSGHAAGPAGRRRPGGAARGHVAGGADHRRAAAQRDQRDSAGTHGRA